MTSRHQKRDKRVPGSFLESVVSEQTKVQTELTKQIKKLHDEHRVQPEQRHGGKRQQDAEETASKSVLLEWTGRDD